MKTLIVLLSTAIAGFVGWQCGSSRPREEKSNAVSAVASTPAPTKKSPASPEECVGAIMEALEPEIKGRSSIRHPELLVRSYAAAKDFDTADLKAVIVRLLADRSRMENKELAGGLLGLWAERDLPAAREWVLGIKKDENYLAGVVFSTWAQGDLPGICDWAQTDSKNLGSPFRQALTRALASGAGRTDPERGLRTLASLEPGPSLGSASMLYFEWARNDPKAAIERAEAEPGGKRIEALNRVIGTWSSEDPEAAATWAAQLTDPLLAERTFCSVAAGIRATGRFNEAADYLASVPQSNSVRGGLQWLTEDWAQYDLPGALRWTAQLPDEAQRSELLKKLTPKASPEEIEQAITTLPVEEQMPAREQWQAAHLEKAKSPEQKK